jgi:NADP-dependent 3-hydroxy acid dehydrogenase YdfG
MLLARSRPLSAMSAATVEKVDPWGGLDVMFNNAGIMHADDAGEFLP